MRNIEVFHNWIGKNFKEFFFNFGGFNRTILQFFQNLVELQKNLMIFKVQIQFRDSKYWLSILFRFFDTLLYLPIIDFWKKSEVNLSYLYLYEATSFEFTKQSEKICEKL